mgnify:CR=1 FL=1
MVSLRFLAVVYSAGTASVENNAERQASSKAQPWQWCPRGSLQRSAFTFVPSLSFYMLKMRLLLARSLGN